MNRRILVKLGALTAAFIIAAVPATTVFAEDLTTSVFLQDGQEHNYDNVHIIGPGEDGNTGGITASNGTIVNVSGDIINENKTGSAIYAWGNNPEDGPTMVNVEGSVTGSHWLGSTVVAYDNAIVTIDGDVTHKWIMSGQNNMEIQGYAIHGERSYNSFLDPYTISETPEDVVKEMREAQTGEINIGGNVTSETHGVFSEGLPINVEGNVTADRGAAVFTSNGGTVRVKGDVTGDFAAIQVYRAYDDVIEYDTDRIIVEGTIKAANGSAIRFINTRDSSKGAGGDYNLPEIVVYQIDESNKDSIVRTDLDKYDENGNNTVTEEELKKTADAILSAINYIIKTEGDIQLSGDSLREYDGLDTMRYGETVTASVADGYTVEGSDAVTVTKVSDGVYNITLDSHLGGITLKAVVDESQGNQQIDIVDNSNQLNSQQWQNIMTQIQNRQAQDSNNDNDNNNGNSSSDATTPASVNNVVTLTSSGDPAAPTSLSADGTTPAREVSINVSEATPEVFQAAVIGNIDNTPEGSTLRIETDTVACLDTAMLESFAAKNIDVEVVFTYNRQKLKVVIPKGYDINKLLDDKGYCGFLRLAGILGSEVIG